MEGQPQKREAAESPEHYVKAIEILEEKYRRGEVRLADLLYGYDQVQAKLYEHLNPDGPPYSDTWQAAVTHNGQHYTKLKSIDETLLTLPQKHQHDLNQLLERIGKVLDRETIDHALKKAQDPDLTDEEFKTLCSDLLSMAIRRLNER